MYFICTLRVLFSVIMSLEKKKGMTDMYTNYPYGVYPTIGGMIKDALLLR